MVNHIRDCGRDCEQENYISIDNMAAEGKSSVAIFYNFRNSLFKNGQRIYNILALTVAVNKENVYE